MPRPTLSCLARRYRHGPKLRPLWLCVALLSVQPALAEPYEQLWSVRAFGIKVGELALSVEETSSAYAGAGSFRTTGLAGILRSIQFTVSGEGNVRDTNLLPTRYDGFINTGKRISETILKTKGGLLVKTKGAQDPATPIAPDATKGALDPMSMMWLVLRDQSDATLCQIDRTQFDGTRLVRITLQTRQSDGDSVTCSGTYDRIGGYSEEELAELKTSPLSITYERSGDLWRASDVYLTSRHGKAKLVRRE